MQQASGSKPGAGVGSGAREREVLPGCPSAPGSPPWVVLSSCPRFCHWSHFLQTDTALVTRCPSPRLPGQGCRFPSGRGLQLPHSSARSPSTCRHPYGRWLCPASPVCLFFLTLLLLFTKRSSCSTAGACFGKPHFHWGRKKAFLSKRNLFGAGALGQLLGTEIPRTFCQGILQMETWPHKTQHSLLRASSWAFLPRLLTLLFQESIFRHGICLLGRFPGTPKTCSGSSPSPETWQPAHTPTRLRRALAGAECFLPHLQLSLCWPLGFCRFFTCSLGCSPTPGRRAHPATTATTPGPCEPSLATSSLPWRPAEGCQPQQSAAFVISIVLFAASGIRQRSWCQHRGCCAPPGPSVVL